GDRRPLQSTNPEHFWSNTMSDYGVGMNLRSSARWAIALSCVVLAGAAGAATPGDNVGVVRDLASRVGPIVGSALACAEISHPRIQVIADKFRAVIREVSTNEAERDDISRLFDRYVNDGRSSVTPRRMGCQSASPSTYRRRRCPRRGPRPPRRRPPPRPPPARPPPPRRPPRPPLPRNPPPRPRRRRWRPPFRSGRYRRCAASPTRKSASASSHP